MCGGSVSAQANSRTIRATLAGSPPSLPQYVSICFMLAPTDGSYSGRSGSRAACARLPQWKGGTPTEGRDLDDVPATLLAHHRKGGASEVHDAEQTGLDQLAKFDLPTKLRDEIAQLIGVACRRDDLVPGLQSRFGDGTTEAAAASHDQPDFWKLSFPLVNRFDLGTDRTSRSAVHFEDRLALPSTTS